MKNIKNLGIWAKEKYETPKGFSLDIKPSNNIKDTTRKK